MMIESSLKGRNPGSKTSYAVRELVLNLNVLDNVCGEEYELEASSSGRIEICAEATQWCLIRPICYGVI